MRIELDDTPQESLVSLTQASLRCVLGGILLFHGLEKLQNPGQFVEQLEAADIIEAKLLTQAVFALELFAGACLVIGRFTRTAAFLAVCDVAGLSMLRLTLDDAWLTPATLEPIALMTAASCFFLVVGSGPYGLDYVLKRRRRLKAIAKDDIWSRPPYVTHR
jgi:putative oxidoreductase